MTTLHVGKSIIKLIVIVKSTQSFEFAQIQKCVLLLHFTLHNWDPTWSFSIWNVLMFVPVRFSSLKFGQFSFKKWKKKEQKINCPEWQWVTSQQSMPGTDSVEKSFPPGFILRLSATRTIIINLQYINNYYDDLLVLLSSSGDFQWTLVIPSHQTGHSDL